MEGSCGCANSGSLAKGRQIQASSAVDDSLAIPYEVMLDQFGANIGNRIVAHREKQDIGASNRRGKVSARAGKAGCSSCPGGSPFAARPEAHDFHARGRQTFGKSTTESACSNHKSSLALWSHYLSARRRGCLWKVSLPWL